MKFFSHELAIDLGTANTVIFHKGQIALDEPSIVAIDTKTGDLIAVGEEALHMEERSIKALRPSVLCQAALSRTSMPARR